MVFHWGCRIHRPLFWVTIEGLNVVARSSVATGLAPRRCDVPKTQWRGAQQIPRHAVFLPMHRSPAHGRLFQQAAAQDTVVHQGRTWLVRCCRRWIIIFRRSLCDCCGTRRRKSIVPLMYGDQLVILPSECLIPLASSVCNFTVEVKTYSSHNFSDRWNKIHWRISCVLFVWFSFRFFFFLCWFNKRGVIWIWIATKTLAVGDTAKMLKRPRSTDAIYKLFPQN